MFQLFLAGVRAILFILVTSIIIVTSCGLPKRFQYVPSSLKRDTLYSVKHAFSVMLPQCYGRVLTNKSIGPTHTDKVILSGYVLNKKNKPVPGCAIDVYEKSTMHVVASIVTDALGFYETILNAGDYDIEYALPQHESVEIEKTTFIPGQLYEIDIEMGDHVAYVYYEFWTKHNLDREKYFEIEKYVQHHKRYRVPEPKE